MSDKSFKVYTVVDEIAGNTVALFYAPNNGLAIRQNLPYLAKAFPVNDLKLYCIGEFNEVEMVLTGHAPQLVDWNEYKFPVSQASSSSSSPSA